MRNILVEKDSITEINGKNFCVEHQKPLRICNECQSTIINKLDIHKDIKSYITNFLPNITKFPFIIYEEEDDDMEDCHRIYMAFAKKLEKMSDGMFYFYDCSEEFIFGFLSYLSFVYCSCNENYFKRYKGKFQYELAWEYTLPDENKNMTVMTSYNNDGYFHAYLTSEPEEFKNGWYVSQKIRLGVCKYDQMQDETIYQDKMKFQEIRKTLKKY